MEEVKGKCPTCNEEITYVKKGDEKIKTSQCCCDYVVKVDLKCEKCGKVRQVAKNKQTGRVIETGECDCNLGRFTVTVSRTVTAEKVFEILAPNENRAHEMALQKATNEVFDHNGEPTYEIENTKVSRDPTCRRYEKCEGYALCPCPSYTDKAKPVLCKSCLQRKECAEICGEDELDLTSCDNHLTKEDLKEGLVVQCQVVDCNKYRLLYKGMPDDELHCCACCESGWYRIGRLGELVLTFIYPGNGRQVDDTAFALRNKYGISREQFDACIERLIKDGLVYTNEDRVFLT